MKSSYLASMWALLAALAGIVVVSALWIVNLRMGPPLDGFTAGPTVILMPVASLVLAVVWLFVRSLLPVSVRSNLAVVVVGTLVLGYAAAATLCGPLACFMPGPNRMLGWFMVGGAVLAVLLYSLVMRSFERRGEGTGG